MNKPMSNDPETQARLDAQYADTRAMFDWLEINRAEVREGELGQVIIDWFDGKFWQQAKATTLSQAVRKAWEMEEGR